MFTAVGFTTANSGNRRHAQQQVMDKQNVIYSHTGILLSHGKGWSTAFATTSMALEHMTLSERNQTQRAA